MQINPYLVFPGTCREAFTFYAEVLGGQIVAMSTHADMPSGEEGHGPEMADKVLHAMLMVDGNAIMGSDAPASMYETPQGSMVTLTVDTEKDAERIYAAFLPEAQVMMELQETFWASRFAMLRDRFGTQWMISCSKPLS